jgi:hypothetical protein
MSKRAMFWAAGVLAVAIAGSVAPMSTVEAAPKKPATKDVPLKVNASLKPKLDARIAPFSWGMSSADALKQVDKMIDEAYAKKTEKAYNPKIVASLEKMKDKDKKKAADSIVEFTGLGLSGYEIKAPHEFTYKNKESALAVSRPSGVGDRMLFFINDRLWKVFDVVPLGVAPANKPDADDLSIVTFDTAKSFDDSVKAMTTDFSDPGKAVGVNVMTPSWYGTLGAIPLTHLWSDGKTQVRLVDYTTREDMTTKSVAIAYEQIETLDQLPTFRVNVEKKTTDAMVDLAGDSAPKPSADTVTPKKK